VIGRADELARLRSLLAAGRGVRLEGEAGIGKTTVWRAALERAGVQAIQPDLKVIFVSGYGTSPYGSARDDPVIAKPFTTDDLLARVKELIAAAASG
jgi:predicted ATPase